MAFTLPPLPYDKSAFGEALSAETFDFHHGKHHQAYVTKANEMVAADASLQGRSLLDLIRAAKAEGRQGLFNQVGQIWNHSFYWQCLCPERQEPQGELANLIETGFGGLAGLIEKLKAEAVGHFASGWAALNLVDGKLQVTSYHDADTPVADESVAPLLIFDVWEHAYYIDYRNARPSYADTLLNGHINWTFVAQNLDGQGASRADQAG